VSGDIHVLLSGWGVGWNELVERQRSEGLANVTLIEPVAQSELVDFLASADLWIIPYRRNRGRVGPEPILQPTRRCPVIVAAEPDSEVALLAQEEDVGCVVAPEAPIHLAEAIRLAAQDRAGMLQKGRRAAQLAEKYGEEVALARYRDVVPDALRRRRS
jgi:hypothetical protein